MKTVQLSQTTHIRLQDYVSDLSAVNSVIDSYASLAADATNQNPTTIQQVAGFLHMIYEKQSHIISNLEKLLKEKTTD